MKKYLSPETVAEYLDVSPVTVRKWLRKGVLNGKKVGSRLWRISEDDLAEFLNDKMNNFNHNNGINSTNN